MQDMEESNLELEGFDMDEDIESKVAKVEVGNNLAIISDELENGDPFYVLLCDNPLHQCEATFEDDWGNQWYEGEMILRIFWYHHVPDQRGQHTSYRLLNDASLIFAHSHLVLKSNFLILPNATMKGSPQFTMPLEIKDNLIVTIEERQNYGQN
jgi:hypothetical protein